MTDISKGMETLECISYQTLEKFIISPGYVYWKKSDKQFIKISNPAQPIDHKFLKRYKLLKDDFLINWVTDLEKIQPAIMAFKELNEAQLEDQKILAAKKILNWFSNGYWFGTSEAELLALSMLGIESLYKFDHEQTAILQNMDINIYVKSTLSSTVAVICAIAMGYTDHHLLQDLYHIMFVLDIGFIESGFSYYHHNALENERINPGSGIEYLKHHGQNTNNFFYHPKSGENKANEFLKNIINKKDLTALILFHHESLNGKGIPNGLNEDNLTDLDKIIIFAGNFISHPLHLK